MKMNNNFDNILDECLERIIKGETVESCLKLYPEQAKELEPLLKTAVSARVMSSIQPRAEFKVRARSEFQAAVREIQSKKSQKVSIFSWLQWRPAWSIAAGTAAVVVIALVSMVAAAGNSMPNDRLYSLKIVTENVQLAVTPSEIGKAELNAKFADKRVDELIQMTSTGTSQEVLTAANNLSVNMSNMAEIVSVEGASVNVLSPEDSSKSFKDGPLTFDSSTASSVSDNPPEAAGIPENATSTNSALTDVSSSKSSGKPVPAVPSTAPGARSGGESFGSQSEPEKVVQGLEGNSRTVELEKVREIIANNYIKRQERLEEVLGKVSLEMRPVILQALDQSTFEYEKAMRNIDIALISE
jgi:hypothetical protein